MLFLAIAKSFLSPLRARKSDNHSKTNKEKKQRTNTKIKSFKKDHFRGSNREESKIAIALFFSFEFWMI